MTKNVKKYDFSDKRRVLIVPDVHGMFTLLKKTLVKLDYDETQDQLVFLGDLVDRGPESHQAIEWAHYPRVMGNHEDLAAQAAYGYAHDHIRNGGKWLQELSKEERLKHARILIDAPYAIEFKSPGGNRIGCVHADVYGNNWYKFLELLKKNDFNAINTAIWSRSRISRNNSEMIYGIDHVFFGHTVLPEPLTMGNCSWIDRGACFEEVGYGELCIVDPDKWLFSLK